MVFQMTHIHSQNQENGLIDEEIEYEENNATSEPDYRPSTNFATRKMITECKPSKERGRVRHSPGKIIVSFWFLSVCMTDSIQLRQRQLNFS